jgi:hypothetical protein
MTDPVRQRLPFLSRVRVHWRMFRNAYRVTARGLRYPVMPGDKVHLEVKFTIHIDERGFLRA